MNLSKITIYIIILQIGYLIDSYSIRVLPLFLLFFTISKFKNISLCEIFNENKVLIFYILLLCFSLLRTNNPKTTISIAIYNIIILLLYISFFSKIIKSDIEKSFTEFNGLKGLIIYPFTLLCLTNFVLYILGISFSNKAFEDSSSIGEAVLLTSFGLHIDRVQFPLAGGINNYSSYLGGILTLALTYMTKIKYTFKLLISVLVLILSLLLIDSRAAILYPLIIAFFMWLHKKNSLKRHYPSFSLLIIIGPLVLTFLLPLLASFDELSFLSRSDGDLKSGNSRFIIWLICTMFFLDFKLTHIFGYGDYGHFGSKVSLQWSYFFDKWEDSTMKTPHNTFFSILFDTGYLGLICYTILIWQLISKLRVISYYYPEISLCLFSFLLYHILAGITETFSGLYYPNYLILFVSISIYINILHKNLLHDFK